MSSEFIKLDGDRMYVYEQLVRLGLGSERDAEKIISFLTQHSEMLSPKECIRMRKSIDSGHSGMPNTMCFIILGTNYKYYVNIKITTLVMVALILDITLTKGLANAALLLGGVQGQGIVKLDEFEGQKCIVKETLMLPKKMGNETLLKKFNGECCNCDFFCKYQDEERCSCTEKQIIEIYESLVRKNIFMKKGNHYVYQK